MNKHQPIMRVRNLSVTFRMSNDEICAVENVGFEVFSGQTLCIVGESGSGKSATSLALTRLTEYSGGRISEGTVHFDSQRDGPIDLLAIAPAKTGAVRGRDIGMVFQDPSTTLNPVLTIGRQMTEGLVHHFDISRSEAEHRAITWLERAKVPDARGRMGQYPHELSGGLRQRVTIAMALACDPRLLIADEPTTALDVTVQREILALLHQLKTELDLALIVITHDMGVVAQIADQVAVMHKGSIVEMGDVESVFNSPKHEHTRLLIQALPALGAGEPPRNARALDPVLQVRDLCVRYALRQGVLRRVVANVHAVEGVSFDIARGQTLGLVGESGSGKTSVGKAILRLTDADTGQVMLDHQDVTQASGQKLHQMRRDMQMVFQDPATSLDPARRLGDQVAEPLQNYRIARGDALWGRVKSLFEKVQLSPELMYRYPHEVSGGQRQRVAIARALALSPKLIVADEAVSALDTNVQGHVLDLFRMLQDELQLSYLFISHDLAVIEQVSHDIAVMYRGLIVEKGPTRAILDDPQHAYTKSLIGAVLPTDPTRRMPLEVQSHQVISSPVRPTGSIVPSPQYQEIDKGHFVLTSECGYET